jgi:hypothetical protein
MEDEPDLKPRKTLTTNMTSMWNLLPHKVRKLSNEEHQPNTVFTVPFGKRQFYLNIRNFL